MIQGVISIYSFMSLKQKKHLDLPLIKMVFDQRKIFLEKKQLFQTNSSQ